MRYSVLPEVLQEDPDDAEMIPPWCLDADPDDDPLELEIDFDPEG